MSNAKVGLSYRSTRRNWVKLWTHEWLRGTSRFELTPLQRSAFIDILALAGDSKVPGKVCAGLDADGSILGFPLSYVAGILTVGEAQLEEVLSILEKQGRIEISKDIRENWILTLTGWEKYQSEYHRQKGYRSNSSKVTTEVTSETPAKLPVEVEVEVEGEGDMSPSAPVISVDISEEPKTISERDLRELWGHMRKAYKRLTGKSLGAGIKGSPGERFRELVSEHDQDKVLSGFEAFIENKGKKYLRTLSTPIFLFLKEAEMWIDDAQIKPDQEEPSWEKKMPLA